MLVPIYLLMVNALSAPEEVNGFPKRFYPVLRPRLAQLLHPVPGRAAALWNSVVVAALTMVLAIGLGAPAGYALSRFDFPGKEAFRLLVLMTRAFPLPLLALPLAVHVHPHRPRRHASSASRWSTPRWRCPSPSSSPSRSSRASRVELEEAAWTLGCTRFQAFRKVVLPLALPGIAASAVFAFVISWNEVFAAAVLTIRNRTLTAFLLTSPSTSRRCR